MWNLEGFSEQIELPVIPEGPGVAVIEDAEGRVLQVMQSGSIRRRIGQLLDAKSKGTCVHGPKIYNAQQSGQRIFVRWKLTAHHKPEKNALMTRLHPLWTP